MGGKDNLTGNVQGDTRQRRRWHDRPRDSMGVKRLDVVFGERKLRQQRGGESRQSDYYVTIPYDPSIWTIKLG